METIVIAESAPTPRDLLVYGLKDDYTVLTATDGTTAVELVTRTEPDLIFMALDLPGLDGASAIRQIKAQARLHDIPIIALTTAAISEETACAYAAGCDDVLGKPFDTEQIDAMVRKFLGGG